jgi:hypothetical protein
MRFAAFILRFLAYAIVLGATYGVAQSFWINRGLDLDTELSGFHAAGVTVLTFAPLGLAIIAIVARPVAIFGLFFLVGAMLTAPFALGRFAG